MGKKFKKWWNTNFHLKVHQSTFYRNFYLNFLSTIILPSLCLGIRVHWTTGRREDGTPAWARGHPAVAVAQDEVDERLAGVQRAIIEPDRGQPCVHVNERG